LGLDGLLEPNIYN